MTGAQRGDFRRAATAQLDLLSVVPRCVLPGCAELVDVVGQPCAGCLDLTTALGPLLRPVAGPAMTEQAIAERDAEVAEAYRQQALVEPVDDREWKANQRCWICEERRRCARTPQGWECSTCQEIR